MPQGVAHNYISSARLGLTNFDGPAAETSPLCGLCSPSYFPVVFYFSSVTAFGSDYFLIDSAHEGFPVLVYELCPSLCEASSAI